MSESKPSAEEPCQGLAGVWAHPSTAGLPHTRCSRGCRPVCAAAVPLAASAVPSTAAASARAALSLLSVVLGSCCCVPSPLLPAAAVSPLPSPAVPAGSSAPAETAAALRALLRRSAVCGTHELLLRHRWPRPCCRSPGRVAGGPQRRRRSQLTRALREHGWCCQRSAHGSGSRSC